MNNHKNHRIEKIQNIATAEVSLKNQNFRGLVELWVHDSITYEELEREFQTRDNANLSKLVFKKVTS